MELLVQLQRVGIDEADQVEAVARLAQHLARDLLADEAGADHDRALLQRELTAQQRAGDAAIGRDRERCERPERDNAAAVQVRRAERLNDREDGERGHGDAVEDRPDLVERGVVGTDAIALVQAVKAGEHAPCGQREEQRVEADAAVREQVGDGGGGGQAEQVGQDERPADRRAACATGRPRAPDHCPVCPHRCGDDRA